MHRLVPSASASIGLAVAQEHGPSVLVLGNMPADLTLGVDALPIDTHTVHNIYSREFGLGGCCNVAISAARFGLSVRCLGELGDDGLGREILAQLEQEGIETSLVRMAPGGRTPLVVVLVDGRGEPAYLSHAGTCGVTELPDPWREAIQGASALFVDGWIDIAAMAGVSLAALRVAREAGTISFFDPGPGNPHHYNDWHRDAARLADVVLLNDAEATRLTGEADPGAAARALVHDGATMAIVKHGRAGCTVCSAGETIRVEGFSVHTTDASGAGDSLAGAIIAGVLAELSPSELGLLGNATGAAKVQKRGTGRHMPKRDEVLSMLRENEVPPAIMRILTATGG